MEKVTAIVLAAGQGTRMKSRRAKVLHELCGRPMLHHVLEAAFEAGVTDAVVVVGFDADNVRTSLAKFGDRVKTALQAEQKGTGHAVGCALPEVDPKAERLLVLCGDTPLLRAEDLKRLREALGASGSKTEPLFALLTCRVPDPTGYGRIVRDDKGAITAIVEHRDASDAQRAIDEINPGMYAARADFLREAVARLKPNNAQGELYFTDVVAQAAEQKSVLGVLVDRASTLVGINDRAQLHAAEEVLYETIANDIRKRGSTLRGDVRVDAGVVVGPECILEHGVVLRGATTIGEGAFLDIGCVLTDVTVAAGARLQPYTVATKSSIGPRAQIGPFSHLRPESDIGEDAHVGNFVETKKTRLHKGAKANHLAYLGDGEIGEAANVGAGTIFCNYDGFKKHKTTIGKGAFIGSDSQLVAPITIGEGAYVATGTTVTKDVPADALAIARVRQENKEGYASRLKSRLKAAQKDEPKKE